MELLAFGDNRGSESRMFATKHPAFCYQTFSLYRKNIVFSRLSAGLFFPARGLVLA